MHRTYMEMAISLAKKAYDKTYKNPLVGAVIVKNDQIIGKGYHKKFGSAHAEIEAINSVKNKKHLKGSTLYVTLEPCNHHGKTPPCTKAIIDCGISKVVIGSIDPFEVDLTNSIELNKGIHCKGSDLLREHGIEIITGILEKDCEDINDEFFKIHKEKKIFVAAKIASSIDGQISLSNGKSKWITNEKARTDGRKLRCHYDGILVGINTILSDNPLLTARPNKNNPTRIVIDPQLRIPMESSVLNNDSRTIVVTRNCQSPKVKQIEHKGHEVFITSNIDLNKILPSLFNKGIQSLLIEGGSTTITGFLGKTQQVSSKLPNNLNLIDKIIHYQAPIIIGGDGKNMIGELGIDEMEKVIKLELIKTTIIGDNIRRDYRCI